MHAPHRRDIEAQEDREGSGGDGAGRREDRVSAVGARLRQEGLPGPGGQYSIQHGPTILEPQFQRGRKSAISALFCPNFSVQKCPNLKEHRLK